MRGTLALTGLGFLIIIVGAYFITSRTPTTSAVVKPDGTISSSTSMSLSLRSVDFQANGMIPPRFTCDGDQVNPSLQISGVPEGAKTLALIVDDPDIPQKFKDQMHVTEFVHWVVFNIPPSMSEIAVGMTAGTPGANGAGKQQYAAPCPPKEYEPSTHRYFFKLYALDSSLSLQAGATKQDVEKSMDGHILEQAELIGLYKKI
jgi:Raf kinase inhibitor-like YbhB/YbcL family protein